VWAGGVRRMITIVTTLTNPQKYPAKELVKLLGERWAIEEYQPDYESSARFYQLAA